MGGNGAVSAIVEPSHSSVPGISDQEGHKVVGASKENDYRTGKRTGVMPKPWQK